MREGIAWIEDERRLGGHPRAPTDARPDRAVSCALITAGEATAHLSNYGEPIGTLRATKWRPPFAVTILSATPDKPEFTFTKGESCRITLKNADPMTYQVAVSMEVDGGASDAHVTLSPNSSALLELL